MLRRLLARARWVLQLDDPPWRIALALAVGVFISCTPTFGFQTLLAILIATLARLNRAATVTGAWLNLPWMAPFVYAGALKLGHVVVPDRGGLGGFWLMLMVGTTIVGVAAAAVTYFVSFGALSWRRRRLAPGPGSGVRTEAPREGLGRAAGVTSPPRDGRGSAADVPKGREPAA